MVVTASPQACEVAELDHRPRRELLGGPYVLAEEAAEAELSTLVAEIGALHLRGILREYETHHNRHRPHRSLDSAAPLKPLPRAGRS
jgi:hypothetical protein